MYPTRETYLDFLRVIATFAVIIIHLAAQNWYAVEVGTYEWKVFYVYGAVVRWSVPVFVMISGALFLGRTQRLERIFRKNILRIVTAFIFWSAIYALTDLILGRNGLKSALREFVEGPVHLWFLFMIVGLYLLVPLLKKIVEDDELTGYFVLLSFLFTFGLPYIVTLLSLYSEKFAAIAGGLLKSMCFYFTLGYVGYFVYGYCFSRINMKWKKSLIVYLLGIMGLLVTLFPHRIFPISVQDASDVFYENMTLNVMFTSVALFIFARNHLNLRSTTYKVEKILKKLSENSFGIYLVHALIITLCNHNPLFKLNTLYFEFKMLKPEMRGVSLDPAMSIPVIAIIVFAISFVISEILHRIPGLKRYVV